MHNWLDHIPSIPLAEWAENTMDWMTNYFASLFSFFQTSGTFVMNKVTDFFISIPPILFILIFAGITFFITSRKWGLATFTFIGLLFIYNQGLWEHLMFTITLVLFSSVIAVLLGIPFGILMAKNSLAEAIIKPMLDFMQTMPSFVYLIPAVAFFGIGIVPGVFASIIFAIPPTVRFTNLGIRQIPKELTESSESFGSTSWQKLIKIDLPLAKSTIMAGINQTVMLSLSMVVIASMIGAPGLGRDVLSALQRAQVGNGFVAGISLVLIAIIIDRLTQNVQKKREA